MNDTPEPALPESVAVALAAIEMTDAKPEEVPERLFDMRTAWLEAVEDGEDVDAYAVADAIPPQPPEVADAIDTWLAEVQGDVIRAMPILLTFANANPVRALSGIRVLSFEAGKEGDDFEEWRAEAETALIRAMRLSDGPVPLRLDLLMDALEDAFFAGRQEGGIEGDPPSAEPHPVYAARITAARRAVADRLAEAADLDDLVDAIRDDFGIQHGDAWLAVEEVSRAAAVVGDKHANRLRHAQIVGVHTWFADHADRAKSRGKLTVGTMVMAERSRSFLKGIAT